MVVEAMVVDLTITEINYLVVSLLYQLMRLFAIYICDIKFFGCGICLVFGMATNAVMPLSKVIHHCLVGVDQAKLFKTK